MRYSTHLSLSIYYYKKSNLYTRGYSLFYICTIIKTGQLIFHLRFNQILSANLFHIRKAIAIFVSTFDKSSIIPKYTNHLQHLYKTLRRNGNNSSTTLKLPSELNTILLYLLVFFFFLLLHLLNNFY